MTVAIIVAAVVVVLVIAAVGVLAFRRHREDPWRNADFFLPNTDPMALGSRAVARYRRRPRTPGGATDVVVSAELRCHEVLHKSNRRASVVVAPLEVIDYSSPDLVEADVVIVVPANGVPPSLSSKIADIQWSVAVSVDAPDGTHVDVDHPVVVATTVVT